MRISVVVPAYNAGRWLAGTVQSVRRQTLQALEIIVVDDGSTDGTAEVCRRLAPSVRLVQQENRGLAAARNAGAAVATGDGLLFLDADDRLLPHALEALASSLEETGFALAYGYVLGRGETFEQNRLHGFPWAAGKPPKPVEANFWWTAVTTPGAALVRRSLHEDIGGFDEPLRHLEDAEYWLRCGMLTGFAHCDTVVLDKTWAAKSLGSDFGRNTWYRIKAQRRFLDWCRVRGLDTSFLRLQRGALTDHAIRRIFHLRAWRYLEPVLNEAVRDRAYGVWYVRGTAMLYLLRATRRLPAPFVPPEIPDTVA
jgi:glycosyltransferase involved in cell wall biosynthesis